MHIIKKLTTEYDPIAFAFNIRCIPFEIFWEKIGKDRKAKASIPQLKLFRSIKEFRIWWYMSVLFILTRIFLLIATVANYLRYKQTTLDKGIAMYVDISNWVTGLMFHFHLLCNYQRITLLTNAVLKFIFMTGKSSYGLNFRKLTKNIFFYKEMESNMKINRIKTAVTILQRVAVISGLLAVFNFVHKDLPTFKLFPIINILYENGGWGYMFLEFLVFLIMMQVMVVDMLLIYFYIGGIVIYITLVFTVLNDIQYV